MEMANGNDQQSLSVVDSQPLPDLAVVDSKPLPSAAPAGNQSPSLWQRAKDYASKFWNLTPPGQVSQDAQDLADWAAQKASEKSNGLTSPLKVGAYGALRDTANLVHGATTPKGVATAIATAAAPEVMGPALMLHGGYKAYTGAPTSWGDLANPDVMQHELSSVAEMAGGAAATASALGSPGLARQAIQAKYAQLRSKGPTDPTEAFQTAVPSTRSAPYRPEDLAAARPYLEAEHQGTPITDVQGLRDAADSAIGKIDDNIDNAIHSLPQQRYADPSILQGVRQALSGHTRASFADQGMQELQDFNLDQPKNIADLDAIRQQLNAENKAVLKQNNYDVANARTTDPAFAAREAAASILRDKIRRPRAVWRSRGARDAL
jgi:hypothetical protein